MSITVIILRALLCVFFLITGTRIASGKMAHEFKRFGFPSYFNSITGVVEITGAIGMAIGIWFPVVAAISGILLGCAMLLAALTLIVIARDPFTKAIPALVLMLLCLSVTIVQLDTLQTLL